MSPGTRRRGPGQGPSRVAATKQILNPKDATSPWPLSPDGEPGLFDVVVTTHPDSGSRVEWTVPTPEQLRDEGVEQVERHASSYERDVIDTAVQQVLERARTSGTTFTANVVRPLLPPTVNPALIGARFLAAARAGRMVRVGYARSSSPRTRSAVVAVWRPC